VSWKCRLNKKFKRSRPTQQKPQRQATREGCARRDQNTHEGGPIQEEKKNQKGPRMVL